VQRDKKGGEVGSWIKFLLEAFEVGGRKKAHGPVNVEKSIK